MRGLFFFPRRACFVPRWDEQTDWFVRLFAARTALAARWHCPSMGRTDGLVRPAVRGAYRPCGTMVLPLDGANRRTCSSGCSRCVPPLRHDGTAPRWGEQTDWFVRLFAARTALAARWHCPSMGRTDGGSSGCSRCAGAHGTFLLPSFSFRKEKRKPSFSFCKEKRERRITAFGRYQRIWTEPIFW